MFRIFSIPNSSVGAVLSWTLFAVAILLYLRTSHTRHLENPEDRIVPTLHQLTSGFTQAALKPAEEDEEVDPAIHLSFVQRLVRGMLFKDTMASGRRFIISLILMFPAVFLGLQMGAFPWINRFFGRFVIFFDKIVALSILPILFIAFGIGEFAKVMLMVIGVAPTIIMDTLNLTKSVPDEQVIRAFTLGARDMSVTYRVILPQIWPRVLNSIRLNLKSLVLFLFAGEMIASQDGLAYRIALMQRHMGMDVIIPYVLWTALLLFLIDASLRVIIRLTNPLVSRELIMPFIELKDVSVRYPLKNNQVHSVFSNLNLEIAQGDLICIIGETGCGKSTLLRLLLGSEMPASGEVTVDGKLIKHPSRDRGYVPQRYSLFPDKTVIRNVAFGPLIENFSIWQPLSPAWRKRRSLVYQESKETLCFALVCMKEIFTSIQINFRAVCSSV